MAVKVSAAAIAILRAAIPQLESAVGLSLGEIIQQDEKDIMSFATTLAAFDSLSQDPENHSGLNFAYRAGNLPGGVSVAAGTVLLTAANMNYVQVSAAGAVSANTSGFTATGGFTPLYTVDVGASDFELSDITDNRVFMVVPPTSQQPATLTITPGTESANAIDVTIQLKNAAGGNLAQSHLLELWLSDSAAGWECASAPSGGVSVQTGTAADVPTAGKRIRVLTNSSGVAVIRITESTAKTFHMRVLCGSLPVTQAVTFA